jgi:hypothetical protein
MRCEAIQPAAEPLSHCGRREQGCQLQNGIHEVDGTNRNAVAHRLHHAR